MPNPTTSAGPSTSVHDRQAPVAVFRTPLIQRLLSLFGVIVLGGVTAMMTGAAVFLLFGNQWPIGLFIVTPLAAFMGGLTGYVARDLRGRWGLHVELDAHAVMLDLPAGRSLIHRPPALHARIPYADIEAIETRLEAYGSLGMEFMQRAYVLRRRSGDLIFLFEDRAIGTPMENQLLPKVAAGLATRAGVPLHDLGMDESGGGFLGVWGTQAPDWAAPALPLARQMQIWRHVWATGALSVGFIFVALIVRLLSGPI